MSEFWQTVFKRLGTSIYASTAYYPQTDGQSERSNQTVKITLRYYVTANPDEPWTSILPYLQGSLNNSTNQLTSILLNEVVYGFRIRNTLGLLSIDIAPEYYTKVRQLIREQTEDSITFANAIIKIRYNTTHIQRDIRVGDLVFLRLYHGYTIPGLSNRKLSFQRVGPFKVLNKIGKLAFKLELPPTMRIHPVVSIEQLELSPRNNPFERQYNFKPLPVTEADPDAPATAPPYEVERLLDKRVVNG